MVTVPLSTPVAVGANLISNVAEAPGASESVAGWFTIVKPVPVTVIGKLPNSDKVETPVLVIVNVCTIVPLLWTAVPKFVPLAV